MMTRKKKRLIMIGIPSIIILLVIIILGVLYFTTNLFKSEEVLFFEFLEKNSKSIIEIKNAFENEEYDNMLQESNYNQNQELNINYIQNYGTSSESTDNIINKLKLTVSGEKDNNSNYEYKDIRLLNNDEKQAEIEYIKNDREYGIRFTDLYKQYLMLENDNLKSIYNKIGYSEQEIENIPDNIEIKGINKDIFSDEEIESLVKKYSGIIKQNLTGNRFSKQKNQTITIDGENIITNAYSIKMTIEELNNTYIKILENLKDDEIILEKIEKIQGEPYINLLESLGINFFELNNINIKNLKDSYINIIDNKIQSINKTNIGNEECEIVVYEKDEKLYKTKIKFPEKEISFNHQKSDKNYSSFNISKEGNDIKTLTLKEKDKNIEINYKDDEIEPSILIEYKQDQKNDSDKYSKDTSIKYEYNNNKLEINFIEKTNLVNEISNVIKFNNDNSINLNYLDSDKLKAISYKVKEDVTNKMNEIEQNLNLKEETEKIFKDLGLIKEKIVIQNERCF